MKLKQLENADTLSTASYPEFLRSLLRLVTLEHTLSDISEEDELTIRVKNLNTLEGIKTSIESLAMKDIRLPEQHYVIKLDFLHVLVRILHDKEIVVNTVRLIGILDGYNLLFIRSKHEYHYGQGTLEDLDEGWEIDEDGFILNRFIHKKQGITMPQFMDIASDSFRDYAYNK